MFKNKSIHDSLLKLIKEDIKRPEFILESKKYGIDLISHAVSTQEVKNASKNLIVDSLTKDKRVIDQEVEVLKYFVTNP